MPYYRVEYYTESEAIKHAVIEAPSEVLIPFRLREKGYTDLKKVKTSILVSPEEMTKVLYTVEPGIPLVIAPVVMAEEPKLSKKKDLYKPSEGLMFLKDGKIGEKYVVAEKVYEIVRISEFSIRVKIGSKLVYVAPNAEVVPFDPKKHAELLIKKEEPEDE